MMATIRSGEMRYYAEFSDLDTTMDLMDISPITTTPGLQKLFTYDVVAGTLPDFTITATPTLECGGCETLTLDASGNRTSQ